MTRSSRRSMLAWGAAMFAVGVAVAIGASDDNALAGRYAQAPGAMPSVVGIPAPGVAGCANPRPEWLWCDDFEQDRSSRYFEYTSNDGALARQRGAGLDGSTSLRARWKQGQVDAGSLKVVFGRNPLGARRLADAGSAEYREVFWRVYVRSEAGWQPNGNDKFTRAIVFAGAQWQEAAIGHVWGGGAGAMQREYVLDPASGIDARDQLVSTHYNDFEHLTWLGQARGRAPTLDSTGRWHCIEAHMRLNDPGSANGMFELWVDDQLDAQRTGLNWVGSYATYGINALFLESYINNGAPRAQVRDYDDLVVSTARIGCDAPSGSVR